MTLRVARRLPLTIGLALVLLLCLSAAVTLAQDGAPSADGYYYVVQSGDSWLGLAWRTGIPVADLKAANPTALHPNDWLWNGERLYIPARPILAPGATPGASSASGATATGYWYQVKMGDNWQTVARDTGVSVLDLWHVNPTQLLQPNRWLYIGQWLWIPSVAGEAAPGVRSVTPTATLTPLPLAPAATPTMTATRTLTPTRTITPTATLTLTPTVALTATRAPAAALPVTPTVALTATGSAKLPTPTATKSAATITPTVQVTPTTTKPAATITPTLQVTPTTKQAATAVVTTTGALTATAAAKLTPIAGCPASMAGYADAIVERLNRSGAMPADVTTWLKGCRALQEKQGSVTVAPITGAASKDVIVAMRDPAADEVAPRGLLLVYHSGSKGYALARKVEGAGQITLLKAGDLNADGKPEITWTDETCGAHTCFSTLFVETWDGKAYQDWIVGEPTIAYGGYTFTDTVPSGSGLEIIVRGGVIASAGAGPQRAWTETYISPKSGPYELFSQVYDDSTCLYHRLLDADKAFLQWTTGGFEPAIKTYQALIADTTVKACGSIENELTTLRDFARFRLIVSMVGGGKSPLTAAVKAQMTNTALLGAADTFLNGYRGSGSVIQACRDVAGYGEKTPASWNFLADWGYANPSFTALDLCPLN